MRQETRDRLVNFVSGLGTGSDKATAGYHCFTPISDAELISAYRGDWIAAKVVDIPAFDMTRAGWDWQAEQDQIEAIEAESVRLQIAGKLFKALKWARLFGGSALLIGIKNDDPALPLNLDLIKAGSIEFLHVVSRYELTPGDQIRNPLSPLYGEPESYTLNAADGSGNGIVTVHASRVIRFIGRELPPYINGGPQWAWGDSVLQALDDAVKNAARTAQGIASLVEEARVDVFKVKDLTTQLSTDEYTQRLVTRFRLSSRLKSTNQALVMDAEEDYAQKTVDFAQLPEVLRLYLQIAAGAADIPATRLLGQAPTGLNATGDSDIRNYYDRLSSEQEIILRPNMERLFEVVIRSALGLRDPAIHFGFAPLWQLSEAEKADVSLKKAETTEIYVTTGMVPPAVLAEVAKNQLIEDGVYPGLEQAYDDNEAGLLEAPAPPEASAPPSLPEKPQRLPLAANDAARLTQRHLTELANELGIPERELRRRLKRMMAEASKTPVAA